MKEADSNDVKMDGDDTGHVDSSSTSSLINPSGIEDSAAVPKEEAEVHKVNYPDQEESLGTANSEKECKLDHQADSVETVICNTVAREFIEGDVLPKAITTYQASRECSSTILQQNTESTSELITGIPPGTGSCASCKELLVHRTPPGICNLTNKERFSSDSIAKNTEESTISMAGNLEESTMTIVNSEHISSIHKRKCFSFIKEVVCSYMNTSLLAPLFHLIMCPNFPNIRFYSENIWNKIF